MKEVKGGVTAAKGYAAAGIEANIKYSNRRDMALIYSDSPCEVAGVFTKNIVKAAPVKWDMEVVKSGELVRAIVVNAGIANACTGEAGYAICKESAKVLAGELGINENQVLCASTGVIGMQIPVDKITCGIKKLVESMNMTLESGSEAARSIMTTDTVSKEIAVEIEIDDRTVTIGGMCKGTGMIHPNMCTMLGFITSDVSISKELLQNILSDEVVDTFNMISVDGDTSTNDTVLVLANGEAGNMKIVEKDDNYYKFKAALHYICEEMAKKLAGDGEGATALFEVKVVNAKTKEDARILSKSVITSSLTKAAIFGHDANWGRILCALGYSGAIFDPENIELSFVGGGESLVIYNNGVATDYSEEVATKILSNPVVTAIVDIRMGDESATAWGCDLTYDYVKINADYRS